MIVPEQTDPWSRPRVEVPSLHRAISDTLIDAIRSARTRPGAQDRPARTVVLLGQPGAGKSHIFARVRATLGSQAAMALVRPPPDARMSAAFLLEQVIAGLWRPLDRGGAPLLLTLAQRISGSTFVEFQESPLVTRLRSFVGLHRDPTSSARRIHERVPEAPLPWLDLLTRLPALPTELQPWAIEYLRGAAVPVERLKALDVPMPLREHECLGALLGLATMLAPHAPLTIFLDQLENLVDDDGARLRSLALLAMELHDRAPGLVLVMSSLDGEWQARVRPRLNESQRDRLDVDPLLLSAPTPAEIEALASAAVAEIRASDPVYADLTVSTAQLDAWITEARLTPRRIIREIHALAARGRISSGDTHAVGTLQGLPRQRFERAFELAVGQHEHDRPPVESEAIARGFALWLRAAGHRTGAMTSCGRGNFLFELEGTPPRSVVFIDAHLPQSMRPGFTAALEAMNEGKQVLLLRSQQQRIQSGWEANRALEDEVTTRSELIADLRLPQSEMRVLLALGTVDRDLDHGDAPARIAFQDWVHSQLRETPHRLSTLMVAVAETDVARALASS